MSSGAIEGKTYTLKELFEHGVYRIDYYQREYAWAEDDVRMLLADLFVAFRDHWSKRGRRSQLVEPYFMGPFVFAEEQRNVRFLVDGQQRFTTLHLVFLHLHRLADSYRMRESRDSLSRAIVELSGGRRTFRIHIDERREALDALYDQQRYEVPLGSSLSLRNLWARSGQTREILDHEITAETCAHFIAWLLEHVVLVGIKASSRDTGYRIFESMNDRGARLTHVDLVKSFLLSSVGQGEETLNKQWRRMLAEVTTIRDDADAPRRFLRAALVGRYAQIANEEDRTDSDAISASLSIWVKKHCEDRLGLHHADDFLRFVEDLLKLSGHYVRFARATKKIYQEDNLASLFYNDVNGIANQMDLVMAAVRPADTPTDAKEKAALVANFLDRLYVLRALREEPLDSSAFDTEIRRLIPLLRQCETKEQVTEILARDVRPESFESMLTFGLRGNNRGQIRYLLARVTAFTEVECGGKDFSEDYLSPDREYQIEHLWPNHPEWHRDEIPNEVDFRVIRSRIGGLALLKRRDNNSLNDMRFLDKIRLYGRQNNLIAILSPDHNMRNPGVKDFIGENDVAGQFRNFGSKPTVKGTVETRCELFRRLAVKIWSPARLGFPVQAQPEAEIAPDDLAVDVAEMKPARRRPARKLNTDLAKLVRSGVVAAESKLVLVHKGVDHFATVDEDGQIWFSTGDVFTKLEEAGRMITERRCDGMQEWKVILPNGDRISVRDLRDSAKASS